MDHSSYRFNRMEIAGSLGDLGTLLPIGIGMILINGLSPSGMFFTIGLFYILSGVYYKVPVPVQPMKVIGAYAIAAGLTASQVTASGLLIGVALLIIGASNAITFIGRFIPKAVIRGIQLSCGVLLMSHGIRMISGTSSFQALRQAAEPYLTFQTIGPFPVGIIIGIIGMILTFILIDSKKFPAGLILVAGGLVFGLIFGTYEGFDGIRPGLYLPEFLPFGFPNMVDFNFAIFALVLPQLPMTIGNAVVANADLSHEYFKEKSGKVTYRALCISMGLANLASAFSGGMPLCHGAGGLAAHYRFGARTAGSNLFIGVIFCILALIAGTHVTSLVCLIPLSLLGVLLLFAGTQLAMTVKDISEKKDLFVVLLMLGITFGSNNLAIGFISGIAVFHIIKYDCFKI